MSRNLFSFYVLHKHEFNFHFDNGKEILWFIKMMVLFLQHLLEISIHEIFYCVSNKSNVSVNIDSYKSLDKNAFCGKITMAI